MNELKDILEDIKSGALPLGRVPGFLLWALAKAFWPLFIIIAAGVLGYLLAVAP